MKLSWNFFILLIGTLVVKVEAEEPQCNGRRYVIIDNDWDSTGFGPILVALDGGLDILALTSVTGDSWQPQCALHAVALLELGNLSRCIPVYEGADWPLMNNQERSAAWQAINGIIPYDGVFSARNATAEAAGADPTGGEPRINKAAFPEGFPKGLPNKSTNAVSKMIELVRQHPHCVSILAAGPLTNVALAVRADPKFAQLAKELVIQGGYVDISTGQATGSIQDAEIDNDTNILLDPEAAKIALTANFRNITVVGNGSNQFRNSQEFLDEVSEVKNPYTKLAQTVYPRGFPAWDETAAAVLANPEIIQKQSFVYIDVDASYASPWYGNVRIYQKAFAPPRTREVKYVFGIDSNMLRATLKRAIQYPKSCTGVS